MTRSRAKLQAVPTVDKPLDVAGDIYRHDRERMMDSAHWAKVHITADRSPPVQLGELVKRIVSGSGVRIERGRGLRQEKRP